MTEAVPIPQPFAAHDRMLRRVFDASNTLGTTYIIEDAVTHQRRPSSAAFTVDADGISLYAEPILIGAGLSARDIADNPLNAVAAVPVAVFTRLELPIAKDPHPSGTPDPNHPRHAAHCFAQGWTGHTRGALKRLRRDLAEASDLVVDPFA